MKDKQGQQQRNQPGQGQNIGQGGQRDPSQPNRGLGQREDQAEEEEEQQEDKEESQQGNQSQRQGYQQGEQERRRQ